MQMIFYHTPLLFQDASELLFLYANQLSLPEPTSQKCPYAIPAPELERIMTEACRNLSREDPTLQFFFHQYKLPDGSNTCLGRVLSFSFADMNCKESRQGVDSICRYLVSIRQSKMIFDALNTFALDSAPGNGEPDAGIHKLKAPAALRQKLLAVYTDPEGQLAPLAELMEPIMEHLSHALLPWVSGASILLQTWEEKIKEETPKVFFRECLHVEGLPPIERLEVGTLYFAPLWTTFGWEDRAATMKIFVGAATGIMWADDATALHGWEYRALHLLSNPDRFRMLKAMGEKPMSSREMAKDLGLHLGAVTRDVNNMNKAYLLNVIHQGTRRRYSLNQQAIRTLACHLLSMCPEEE